MIDDVIAGVRDSFLDEGIDEQVLQEMKQIWTKKLLESKAVETSIEQDTQSPVLTGNTTKSKVMCVRMGYSLPNSKPIND